MKRKNDEQLGRNIKPLIVKPVPVPANNQHPPAPSEQLMNHEFTLGIIAPKGCGKTTVICNLLEFYEKYFNDIIVISPTIESDDKWDVIKEKKLLVENVALKKWIKAEAEKKKMQNRIIGEPPVSNEAEGLMDTDTDFTGKIPADHFRDDYDEDWFMNLMEEQRSVIKMLKKHGKPKHLANRVLVIFDDLVGSALFAGTRGSYFKGINTRHRHYSASFIMVSQGYKEIPKTIRTNWTGLIVFEIGNEREVQVIYEEYAMGLNSKDWLEVYKHCTEEEHSFLYLNYQKPKKMRIMKNFTNYVFVQ